jgi:hypothetical protein
MSAYIKRRITETLPTTLEPGEEIYYQDANGNLTLWVGHADGSAWPAVGYKRIVAVITISNTNTGSITTPINQLGEVPTFLYSGSPGLYGGIFDGIIPNISRGITSVSRAPYAFIASVDTDFFVSGPPYSGFYLRVRNYSGDLTNPSGGSPVSIEIIIDIYP